MVKSWVYENLHLQYGSEYGGTHNSQLITSSCRNIGSWKKKAAHMYILVNSSTLFVPKKISAVWILHPAAFWAIMTPVIHGAEKMWNVTKPNLFTPVVMKDGSKSFVYFYSFLKYFFLPFSSLFIFFALSSLSLSLICIGFYYCT